MPRFFPIMIIRIATIHDAEDIAQNNMLLAEESENIILDFATALAGVKAILSDARKGFYLVAEEKKQIVGQIMITYEWSDWKNTMMWWIQSVYTNKEWRKHGVFSQLLNEIKQRAQAQYVKILRLYTHTTNKNAQQVYKKVGMEKKPYLIYQLKK